MIPAAFNSLWSLVPPPGRNVRRTTHFEHIINSSRSTSPPYSVPRVLNPNVARRETLRYPVRPRRSSPSRPARTPGLHPSPPSKKNQHHLARPTPSPSRPTLQPASRMPMLLLPYRLPRHRGTKSIDEHGRRTGVKPGRLSRTTSSSGSISQESGFE